MQSQGLFAVKPPEADIAGENKCEVKMKVPAFVLASLCLISFNF